VLFPIGSTGDGCLRIKDDAPQELRDAVYAAHDGMLPNDWLYSACASACADIEDNYDRDPSERASEWADGEVDVYNSARFSWASEFCNSNLFATGEDMAAGTVDDRSPIIERLGAIQYYALEFIYGAMLGAYEEGGEE
jgi:hypothetical protein